MPGNTWRDLTSTTAPAADAQPSAPAGSVVARAAQGSPRLAGLLEQRELLENRLHALTSGSGAALDAREAARFRVPSFAERQQQQREWETRRSALQTRALDLRRQARRNGASQTDSTTRPGNRKRLGAGIGDNVTQWLARRDSQRRSLRDAARDRLTPLNEVARVGSRLNRSVSGVAGQLRDLDRQLGAEGLNQERDELRKLGADRLTKASSQIDKYTKKAEAPMRAVRKIDRSWEDRQRQISGAMDRTGPYVNRSQRRLSTDTGGSGDIFARMQRNRQRALERRAEQCRQEKRDEARRQRARRSKNKGN